MPAAFSVRDLRGKAWIGFLDYSELVSPACLLLCFYGIWNERKEEISKFPSTFRAWGDGEAQEKEQDDMAGKEGSWNYPEFLANNTAKIC